MSDIVINIAKGKVAAYAALAGVGNAAIIVVPLETTGIVSDATMKDYADLSTLLAGATNEQTTMGRKTIISATVATDTTNDWTTADTADITWTAATGNAISALLFCYDSDTTSGTDSNIVPLCKFDFAVTPDGSDVTATVANFFKAA